MPLLLVLCRSKATPVTPVTGYTRVATLNLSLESLLRSSDSSSIPPVIAITVAALLTSTSVNLVVLPRRMQSGSLCQNLCPIIERVTEFRTMARKLGNVPWSHQGRGKSGYHVGPVSALILFASISPIAGPIGQPQPIMKVSDPAAALNVCRARCIVSALDMLKSYLPFPCKQAAYKKSSFKTLYPHSFTARRMHLKAYSRTAGFVASNP
mmetsp:Transcript_13303/g.19919  ORF Transcript_13303/g.19919 Transcript_13303/m.19919 type:complete len:210 (+) Transcript_13303:873-1502(+)